MTQRNVITETKGHCFERSLKLFPGAESLLGLHFWAPKVQMFPSMRALAKPKFARAAVGIDHLKLICRKAYCSLQFNSGSQKNSTIAPPESKFAPQGPSSEAKLRPNEPRSNASQSE